MRRRSARSAVLLLIALAGCYRNVPLATGTDPQPNQEVVLTLVPGPSAGIDHIFGPGAELVRGRVDWVRADSIGLKVDRVDFGRNGRSAFYKSDPFVLPRAAVASTVIRKHDTGRSVLLGVGIAAAVVGLGKALGLGGLFGTEDSGGPGTGN
jgi:hypothetical protein